MTWLGNQVILADNGSKSVCLLEGFADFLSLHNLKKTGTSKDQLFKTKSGNPAYKKALVFCKSISKFQLFLDIEKAGKGTAEKLGR